MAPGSSFAGAGAFLHLREDRIFEPDPSSLSMAGSTAHKNAALGRVPAKTHKPIRRAMMSGEPPAGVVTTKRTGRAG